jgi:hypothetical protein
MVIVIVTGLKVRGFKPGRGRRIFKSDRIRSTTSFEREVNPPAHVARFYGRLKIPAEYDRDTSSAKVKDISRQFSPCFIT